MAKDRNKKKKSGVAPMDTADQQAVESSDVAAMDTSEKADSTFASGSLHRKVKKGVQMKRSQSLRKKKALAKAVSRFEMVSEKVSKTESKKMRVKSAKSLYD